MEDIPVPSESIDVVISNGVINLSFRKRRVVEEMYRVLGPGGRISITDIVSGKQLSQDIGGVGFHEGPLRRGPPVPVPKAGHAGLRRSLRRQGGHDDRGQAAARVTTAPLRYGQRVSPA